MRPILPVPGTKTPIEFLNRFSETRTSIASISDVPNSFLATAAAYAAAVARKELGTSDIDAIEVRVSENLFKNSMGVFVPGTGKIGLTIAASVGDFSGDPTVELEVLVR
ncbi:hypothetical protein SZ06_06150, partial [Vibrio parahaemolyticus]